jgi:uncharacterized membrane protein YkoI
MNRTIKYAAVAGVATAVLGGAAAFAAKAPENDAVAIMNAKVGLQQAVAIAEGHVGGKAARAEYEQTKAGKWVFDVEVVKGAAVMDVTVDATSGNVLAAAADAADKDDDHDEAD